MRTKDQRLRACPACGTKVDKTVRLGLRYFGDQPHLPGAIGMMDLDRVLERKGNVLIEEVKPGSAKLPAGQRYTLRTFKRMGCDVWVVWEKTEHIIEVGEMDRAGRVKNVVRLTRRQFDQREKDWFEYADANPRTL